MVVGPGFAAGLFVAAAIEDDRVGALRRLHRLRDPMPVLRGIGECHLVRPPIVVLGDLDALGIDDACPAADLGLDAVERAEEHTSELQSLMPISSSFFCFTKN